MAFKGRQITLPRPTPVAVNNDAHVLRNIFWDNFFRHKIVIARSASDEAISRMINQIQGYFTNLTNFSLSPAPLIILTFFPLIANSRAKN